MNRIGIEHKKSIFRITGKVLQAILDLMCIAAGAAGLLMLVLYFFGYHPYAVQSGSMEPVIPTGSFCFVNTKAEFSQVEAGDVVAFTGPGGSAVTHRVLEVRPEGLVTKGDNNDVPDGLTTTGENFIGVNSFFVPYAGYLVMYLKNGRVRIFLICSLISLFIVTKIVKNLARKEAEPEREKQNPICLEELQEAMNE